MKNRRVYYGLTFGILELLSAAASSSAWAWALKISEKDVWLLFGILNYPLIGLVCISMFVVGVLCVMKSTREFGKREN